MEWTYGQYKVSTDKSLLSLDQIGDLLSQSYWAHTRPREIIARSIENSLCYGVYYNEKQIGFGRIITDYATPYYICDVIIDESFRSRGLGKKLIQCMLESENFINETGFLATRDAHGLYLKSGFKSADNIFMARRPAE